MYKNIHTMKIDVETNNPASNKAIEDAEKQLGLLFGQEYKEFLKEFGCLSIEYLEFYGICGSQSLAPNIIHVTSKYRDEIPSFSKELVVIYEVGDGSFYSIDSRDNVYLCQYDKCEKTNKTFKEFLINKIGEL